MITVGSCVDNRRTKEISVFVNLEDCYVKGVHHYSREEPSVQKVCSVLEHEYVHAAIRELEYGGEVDIDMRRNEEWVVEKMLGEGL